MSSSRVGRELVAGDPVDRPVQLVRVERGQVPLQLVPVPHDERDPAQEATLPLRRDEAEHVRLPSARIEQAGEHLERGRLPGAVRAEEADDLARRNVERDLVDGTHLAGLAPYQTLRGRDETGFALGDVEDLEQAVDTYRRFHQPLRLSFP